MRDSPVDFYVANRRVVHTRNWLIRVSSWFSYKYVDCSTCALVAVKPAALVCSAVQRDDNATKLVLHLVLTCSCLQYLTA